jgi:hypothetical protein
MMPSSVLFAHILRRLAAGFNSRRAPGAPRIRRAHGAVPGGSDEQVMRMAFAAIAFWHPIRWIRPVLTSLPRIVSLLSLPGLPYSNGRRKAAFLLPPERGA